MDQTGLWIRMTQWLRRDGARPGGLPRLGRDGLLAGLDPDSPEAGMCPVPTPARKLNKQQLREQALLRLEDGHGRLVTLMESMRQHMDVQDRQGHAVVHSLEDIAGHMLRMSQSVVKQTETLGAISAQMQAAAERARRVEQALVELPAMADSQRSTLTLLAEQVSAERAAMDRIGESVQAYGGALASLDRSTTSAADALRNLQASSVRTGEELAGMGRRQGKWLALVFAATVAVVLVAGSLMVIALVR